MTTTRLMGDEVGREEQSKGSGATLGDHLVAQGIEANGLYSRGARVKKRETANESTTASSSPEFLAVRIEAPAEVVAPPRAPLVSIRHSGGHVLEFGEWPNATWLAALWSAIK